MKKTIAIPTINGQLCPHFGHCEKFALIQLEDNSVVSTDYITSPPHQPGLLPEFLAQKGVNVIIAGGMGTRAQEIFTNHNIEVKIGVAGGSPEDVVQTYLTGELATGSNLCDH
ncbi:MAG: NifB/NifX family molybdenum-iron cluster-binding protein [Candidatus Cloacimonetes bacterium]|nr:NifB/NifX family molybdenum-iron cluster-binding protein [Candidatus Cloacimonadota bacterium]